MFKTRIMYVLLHLFAKVFKKGILIFQLGHDIALLLNLWGSFKTILYCKCLDFFLALEHLKYSLSACLVETGKQTLILKRNYQWLFYCISIY